MKLGVLTVLLGDLPFEEALDYLRDLGVQSVEIGCGNYPGNAHCDPDALLNDDKACDAFLKAVQSRDMDICALSAHGNPLHPNPKIARAHAETQRKTIQLAQKLGVQTVVGFSGCPGDSDGSKYPNWVTCPWPTDYLEILEWQWEKKVIPYWKAEADFLRAHDARIALEMHPGFVVYNSETCLQLRDACGPEIGANLDPSHLFWQGCDIVAVIRELGDAGALYHFHAKDTKVHPLNAAKHGVLDTKPYTDEKNRSWLFRSVGYGHDYGYWKDIVSELRLVGYDGVLSIEHEDSLMSSNEGLEKGVKFLKDILIFEQPGTAYWA